MKAYSQHIPVIGKSERKDGAPSRVDFRFDPERNRYLCPQGKSLTTIGYVWADNTARMS
ncbi:MAG: hypothetical protein IH626_01610 [Rhodospirillales bacterium]|nr:hypothetical protein [Rhodospirillales bacterium]